MFDIRITVGAIDYEKTMTTLFPIVLDKCRKLTSTNMLLRLFLELGEDAMPVLLDIMERLPESAKQELLCQCMNTYRTVLTEKLNEYLRSDIWGRNFAVRNMYIEQTGGGLELVGEGVSIDFETLLANEDVQSKISETVASFKGFGEIGKLVAGHAGGILKKAVETAPENAEKLGLKLIRQDAVKNRLMGLAQSALQNRGLALELRALSIMPAGEADVVWDDRMDSGHLKLSAELETELIRALAGYLKKDR